MAVRRVLERQRPDHQGFSSGSGPAGRCRPPPLRSDRRAPLARALAGAAECHRHVSSGAVCRRHVGEGGRRHECHPWSGRTSTARDVPRWRSSRSSTIPGAGAARQGVWGRCRAVCLSASGDSYSPRVGSSPTGRADRGHDGQPGDVQYRRRPRRPVGSAKRNGSALTELTAEPALEERMSWDASRKGAVPEESASTPGAW
jgi:hypothetical protein